MKRSKFTADGRQGARVRTELAEPLGQLASTCVKFEALSPAR
jgi:hypothetical protein